MSKPDPWSNSARPPLWARAGTALYALVWGVVLYPWMALSQLLPFAVGLETSLRWLIFGGAPVIYVAWASWARGRSPIQRSLVHSLGFLFVWQFLVFATHEFDLAETRVWVAGAGLWVAFGIGLAWVVWGVEKASRYYDRLRRARASSKPAALPKPARVWNPLDLDAWYYGRNAPKLHQSLSTMGAYSLAFYILVLLLSNLKGCQEIYESPAGGGKETQIAQQMKIQKIIKKKFVINPYSSIIFNPPPIEDIKLQLQEVTEHLYKVGQGEGEGAGFSQGTRRGKVRFIRLEYSGGDWNQDFGVGADLNMLVEYGVRTGQQVAEQTESRTILQLRNFPIGKSPPLMYLTGQKNINVTKQEVATLREYLLDKHGMLFIDNGGSQQFHSQALALMRAVLPEIREVRIPLDDVIHSRIYTIPFLPYVAPHGGHDALGWKVDGRWVCYYHPGDIGDAWSDGHSGVRGEVWERCYQLGTNVIFYAHAEYNKWLDARDSRTKKTPPAEE